MASRTPKSQEDPSCQEDTQTTRRAPNGQNGAEQIGERWAAKRISNGMEDAEQPERIRVAGRLKAALHISERIVIQAKWHFRGTDKSSKDPSYSGTDFVRRFGKYLSKTCHQEAKRHFHLFPLQADDDEDELEEESDSEPSSCASPRRATSCL